MGGLGSGGYSRSSRYLTVEECYKLDLADLALAGFFAHPGKKATGPWSWTTRGGHRDGEETTVQMEIDLRDLEAPRFAIYYRARAEGEADGAPAVSGELVTTRPQFGGVRYWYQCPRCWRRVRVLYAYPARGRERFSCRRCQGLRYYVHSESQPDRLSRHARKLYRRAGSRDGSEPWQKPKWMRWGRSLGSCSRAARRARRPTG
jgi:hypothetical protein